MAAGDLPTPRSSQSSQAGELLSSSPCPTVGKTTGSKPKGKATITPRSFGRFFAPRRVYKPTSTRKRTRRALTDASAASVNGRENQLPNSKQEIWRQVFDEDENPKWGSNNMTQPRHALASPDITPEPTTPCRPAKRVKLMQATATAAASTTATACETFHEDDSDGGDRPALHFPRLTALSAVKRSQFRNLLGNMCRRELGYTTDSYRRSTDNNNYHDWRLQVASFYSGAEDVYVNKRPRDSQFVVPFCAAACHTNSLVAVGDEDGYIKLLETKDDACHAFSSPFHSFRAHSNALIDLEFTTDDSLLATGSGDQTGRVLDMRTQQCIYELRGHASSVKQVRFQPGSGNNVLATSSREGAVRLWDLRCKAPGGLINIASVPLEGESSENIEDLPLTSRMKPAACVKWINQAHSAGASEAIVSTWSDRRLRSQPRREASVTTISFLHSSTPHLLLTGSDADATVRVWDLRARRLNDRHSAPVPVAATRRPHAHVRHRDFGLTSMVLSGDGSRLFTLCKDHTIYAYSTSHLILGNAPQFDAQHSNPGLGASSGGGTTKQGLGPLFGFRHPRLKASTFYVKSALRPAFANNQELLAVGGTNSCAVLFPTDERLFVTSAASKASATSKASGALAASSSKDHDLPIYTFGAALERGHESEVTGLTWTSEGELITVGDDTRCRVWREDAEKAKRLRVHGETGGERWLQGWAEFPDAKYEGDDEEE